MAVMDEFKEEREALRKKPLKERLHYFWDYYKWHTILALLAVIILTSFIRDIVTRKESALFAVLLNAYPVSENTDAFRDLYAEYAGIDTEEFDISFNDTLRIGKEPDEASMNATQMIMVHVAARDMDVMTMDTLNFSNYAYNGTYADLRGILTPEQIAAYRDRLFYIDGAVVAELEEAREDPSADPVIEYPDHRNPDSMSDPIPVGISLQGCDVFNEYYTYGNDEGFMGVVTGCPHTEHALSLIRFLFDA